MGKVKFHLTDPRYNVFTFSTDGKRVEISHIDTLKKFKVNHTSKATSDMPDGIEYTYSFRYGDMPGKFDFVLIEIKPYSKSENIYVYYRIDGFYRSFCIKSTIIANIIDGLNTVEYKENIYLPRNITKRKKTMMRW